MTGARRRGVAELLDRIRHTTLETWRTDPSRLRQDANLEDDHARYHADRLVIELAQNAADAAGLADRPGRLLLRLTDAGVLTVANTGRGLDEAGLRALTSLRASAKTSGVGRFGVGFAAVRSVADDLDIVSSHDGCTTGARFSLDLTRAALAAEASAHPALGGQLARLDDQLPVLRLPFDLPEAAEQTIPDGYDTAVHLRLRAGAEQLVRAALTGVGDPLLLALPNLTEVTIELPDTAARTVGGIAERWLTATEGGELEARLLAQRPVEERAHTSWQVTWAVPRATLESDQFPPGAPAEAVVYAPTPTRDRLEWPALLIATFPLDAARQHVAPGAVRDHLVSRAADGYAALLTDIAHAGDATDATVLRLMPQGIAGSDIDVQLRHELIAAVGKAPLLPAVTGGWLTPRHARAIDGPLGRDRDVLGALAPLSGEFVIVPTHLRATARALGVEFLSASDVIDAIPLAACEPGALRALYEALSPYAAEHREQFATLPVRLADGRVVRGPRGTIAMPAADWHRELDGLPILDPDVDHPLLRQLGAQEPDPAELLRNEIVAARLREPDALPAALHLVARAADTGQGDLPAWLGELQLPAADGAAYPARSLVLPGGFAAEVMWDPVLIDPQFVDEWGAATLRALGARDGLRVMVVDDVVADPALADLHPEAAALDGWPDYLAELAADNGLGSYVGELAVITGLDEIDDDHWPRVIAEIASQPELRAALLTPAGDHAPSYAAWWLRHELDAPVAVDDTIPFMPAAPAWLAALEPELRSALGVITALGELDATGWDIYAGDWPQSGSLEPGEAMAVWQGILDAVDAGVELPAVAVVPAWHGEEIAMRRADDVVVAPPGWARIQPVVPMPAGRCAAVAEALDLDEPAAPDLTTRGARRVATPAALLRILPALPGEYWECDEIAVAGTRLDWWAQDGEAWATTMAGTARALAAAAGQWEQRHLVEQVVSDPARARELWLETTGDRAPASPG